MSPPDAISGGGEYKPDSPEDANLNAGKIKERDWGNKNFIRWERKLR